MRQTRLQGQVTSRRATFVGIIALTALVVFCLDRLEADLASRRLQAALARTSHDLTLHFTHFFKERTTALEMLVDEVSRNAPVGDPEARRFASLADNLLGPLDGSQFAMLLDGDANPVVVWNKSGAPVPWRTLFVRYHTVLSEAMSRAIASDGVAVSRAVPIPEGDYIFFVATRTSIHGCDRVKAATACYSLWQPACRLFNIGRESEYLVFIKDPYDTILSNCSLLPSHVARHRTTFWSGDSYWSLYVHPGPTASSVSNLARMVIWGLGLVLLLGISLFYLVLAEKNNALAAYGREFEEKARKIAEINRKLIRLNKELDDFACTVAHDLKEPLRGIEGLSRLLEEEYGERLDEAGREYLAHIRDSGLRMQRLVGDLLRIARTTRSYPSQEVDFNDLLAEVIERFRYDVKHSGARIHVRGRLPTMWVDRVRMAEVFHNLISNALKFSADRPPVVEIGSERTPEGHLFWVRDNGIGIPPDEHERIFRLFCRGSNGNGTQGSGVGLAICKKIVERHGGSIWVESERGKGTRVCFSLPERRSIRPNTRLEETVRSAS